jgi:hypothetical protein
LRPEIELVMPATRRFRGDRAALTALRLRRIVSFLRRHGLYDTAHEYALALFLLPRPFDCDFVLSVIDQFINPDPLPSTDAKICSLERHTGAFFDAAHFRLLLRQFRWAEASSYALGFVTPGHCSLEADMLVVRILMLRVMDDLAAGRSHGVDALFQRLYASLESHYGGHHLRRTLLSMRSDRARCFPCSSNV